MSFCFCQCWRAGKKKSPHHVDTGVRVSALLKSAWYYSRLFDTTSLQGKDTTKWCVCLFQPSYSPRAQFSVFIHQHRNFCHCTMSPSLPQDMGGLSHLVEAATALTELVGRPVTSSVSKATSTKRIKSPTGSPAVVVTDDDAKTSTITSAIKKKEIFPQKLMEILADQSLSDIVSWLPHGRSFVIVRPDLFCEQVLPKYLPPVDTRGSTKYPSFTRKLNRW
jgi:HSF-type DNA-binding